MGYHILCMLVCFFVLLMNRVSGMVTVGAMTIEPDYGYETNGSLTITITRDGDTTNEVTFRFKTRDGRSSAKVDEDYTSVEDTFSIEAGSDSTTVSVPLIAEWPAVEDRGEYVSVQFDRFSDGNERIRDRIYIIDDSDVDFKCPDQIWAKEHDGTIELKLKRSSADSHGPMTVLVSTEDGSAIDGSEYESVTDGELVFPNNDRDGTFYIDIIDDVIYEEEDKNFTVYVYGDRVVNCTIEAIIVDDDKPDPFHCNRGTSQPCYNDGECNAVSGRCSCPDPYKRPNCLRASNNSCSNEDDICDNGFCQYDEDGSPYCICKGGWTGENCSHPAYYAQCNTNSVGICVSQYDIDQFNGMVYVKGEANNPDCILNRTNEAVTNPNLPSWCRGYMIDLPYNDTDTCGVFGPTFDGSIATFTIEVLIQYSMFGLVATDEILTVFCKVDTDNLEVYTDILEVDTSPAFLKKQTTSQTFSPAFIFISRPDGNVLSTSITIRDRVKVCVSVRQVDAYNCILIEDIMINNNRSNPNYEEEYIYENGCVNDGFKSSFVSLPANEGGDSTDMACFTMTPIVFPEDTGLSTIRMGISVRFKIRPPSASCDPLVCDEGSDRRKRSAINGEEDWEDYVMVEIDMTSNGETDTVVVNDNVAQEASPQGSGSTTVNGRSMLPLLVGATVGGCVFLVVVVVIAFLTYRRSSRRKF